MAKILGLDLGTNSVGWALIDNDEKKILGMGSRIIPMSQDILGDFDKGNSVSQTAERTRYRSVRKLHERHLLRRERLHRVLNVLDFLPKHFAAEIDFEKRLGQFFEEKEPKLAWKKNEQEKFEFLFQSSFNEMITEFKESGQNIKVPYDWTIYYLRKKALEKPITKEELAWLVLHFNQKRGYYQLRGEEEEIDNKSIEFHSSKIIDVLADEEKNKKGETWYTLKLENGWEYRKSSKTPLFDWKDKVRDFIVTTDLNDDKSIKTDKEGKESRSFRAPKEDDWTLVKKKTEQEIEQSKKTVGVYIYETLLQKPTQKIRGKLVRTIERKFYKEELKQILETQIKLQPQLFSEEKYSDCVRELYRNNEAHQLQLSKRNFVHLFLDDIIFYQRPLRSQKSSIGNCSLEYREYKKKDENGKEIEVKKYLKAIPKSNPYYQEFRLWQWVKNLSIYKKEDDSNVTADFLNSVEDFEKLFEFLNNRKEVEQKPLIKFLVEQKLPKMKSKELNAEIEKYRWNYVEDKKYPCNETKTLISTRLEKVENTPADFLTRETEKQLWHIIYSVTDKTEYEKALKSFATKNNLDTASFFEAFKKFPPFKSEYGSYSEKAIKKLLPLMRLGKYWNWDAIDSKTKERIDKLKTAEFDESIKDRVREKAINLTENNHFQGLPLWLASYVVYDRHSEANSSEQWKSVDDLKAFLKSFKQHSLRNPIVEQVVTETLRVVQDIWQHYGNGAENFFDEIHIELGREMKNTAAERERITKQVTENENTNLRIKALLAELKNHSDIENVRPHSPTQQEILKIYEDGVLNSNIEIDDDILKISKTAQPTQSELIRYKLWLEQKYRSPYTGKAIPLSKLFTSAYEIEHIIPQSRYFDDSFSNKVICEEAVNKLKDNQLGLEFIKNHHGQKVQIGSETVEIFTEDAYKDFVQKHYEKNRGKKTKLLLEEIPEKMIERQLNDTRYISKYISSLLSNIVRENQNDDGVNSKNVIPFNGKITSTLKQDWGLNDVWNELILQRFERMNELTKTENFTAKNTNGKIIPTVPLELSKNFQRKRIDHRHHALDALVIACATRDHVNLLNNQSAKSDTKRYDLQYKLRHTEKWKGNNGKERDKFTEFKKPWDDFTVNAKNELEKIVVSFKQNLRVINKATNHYEKWVEKNGEKKKELVEQKGVNWAIRKPLHKEFVYAKVDLPWIKVGKKEMLTAIRKSLDISFDENKIKTSITDTGIQKILLAHLEKYKGRKDEKGKDIAPEALAFTPEGVEDMNKNILSLNDNKFHQPIFKVRVFEKGTGRFPVGQKGGKKTKYVEAAKGTNLFFAIYEDENSNRSYDTIPLNIVVERQKQGLSSVPDKNEKDVALKFSLSPNDLVYVPTTNNVLINGQSLNKEENQNIYKVVSFTGSQIFFVRHDIAISVVNKQEFSSLNKMERAIDGTMIKEICIKLKVDRLGNISKA